MPARPNIAAPRSAACQLLPVPTIQTRSPAARRVVRSRSSRPAMRRSDSGCARISASSSAKCGTLACGAVGALLDKKLVVVTGKGGVGKTTVAAALGLLAARRGRRTVVCEVAQQERLAALFGAREVGHGEPELAPGLFAVSVVPERAMHEWLRYQLHSGALAGLLGHSRLFSYLTAAAPGVSELVTMGKVWDLAQPPRRTGGGP